MSVHTAIVEWRSDGGFRSGRYSRAYDILFDGGARLRGSASPSVVPEPMSDPAGVDPEEALVASASACHMLWFLSLAQAAGLDVAGYRDAATGEMGRDAEGRTAIVRIVLRPDVAWAGEAPDGAALRALHDAAHARCFIANSLRSEIRIDPA